MFLPPLVQSSSTTPYMEAESAYMEKMQGFSQMKCSNLSNLSGKETRNHDDHIESDKEPDRLGSLTGGISNILLLFWLFPVSISFYYFNLRGI